MTVVSVLGVMIGVAALVTVLSVMGGFEQDLKSKMFRGLPHLEVLAQNAIAGFSLQQYPLSYFEQAYKEATGVEPFVQSDVVIKRNKHLASITLFGIDPAQGGKLWGFSQGMIEGEISDLSEKGSDNSKPKIILGESLAIQLGADVGDEIRILSPQARVTDALSGATMLDIFEVVGIFMTDLPRYDSKYAVVNLSAGRKFVPDYDSSIDSKEYVTGVAVNFDQPELVDQYKARMNKESHLQTITWKTVNKSLLFALKLEKFTMGAILLLIVLVAAFSISGTMMMTIYHKRSQVALMRSLGMEQKDIAKLYLTHGCLVGLIGVFLGLCLGLTICSLLYYFQFVDLPAGIYQQKKLPVKFLPFEYVVVSVCAWLLSLGASLYPAVVAAKQDPGTGLRFL